MGRETRTSGARNLRAGGKRLNRKGRQGRKERPWSFGLHTCRRQERFDKPGSRRRYNRPYAALVGHCGVVAIPGGTRDPRAGPDARRLPRRGSWEAEVSHPAAFVEEGPWGAADFPASMAAEAWAAGSTSAPVSLPVYASLFAPARPSADFAGPVSAIGILGIASSSERFRRAIWDTTIIPTTAATSTERPMTILVTTTTAPRITLPRMTLSSSNKRPSSRTSIAWKMK